MLTRSKRIDRDTDRVNIKILFSFLFLIFHFITYANIQIFVNWMASSVSLPLVFWHNFSNPNITCITTSYHHIYAGQKDGHIWVYTLSKDNPHLLQHKFLLVGHKTAVVALCIIKSDSENSLKSEDILISASEDGEIARWNASDGRCQAVNAKGFYGIPRLLKVFTQFSDRHIFCCGQADEITILHASTLEVFKTKKVVYCLA
ncbi:MAG: hypothetical protein EXX96DRAFT_351331 [Benjaminiella poitrasii]|nr:MAG: hypothetical protein EXX96DRAFT_351331 [Benjaminiella poitrasii]